MSKYTVMVRKRVLVDIEKQELTKEERAFMLRELYRIAEIDPPWDDIHESTEEKTITRIAQTDYQWSRQKPSKARPDDVRDMRNILKIDRDNKTIELIAILLRTDKTYDEVEAIWKASK